MTGVHAGNAIGAGGSHPCAGFGKYFRFIVRRERITGLLWLILLPAFGAGLSQLYPNMFPTQESLLAMAATLNNPAMVAMMGPVYGLDRMNAAISMSIMCMMWLAIAAIVMSIYFVNRHTRVDEELGRHEMIASLPVGRLTCAVSAIAGVFVLNMAIAIIIAAALSVIDVDGITTAGAYAYGLSIGMQGFVFGALTLLSAQLFSTARGGSGMPFLVMGVSYLMRASGDMSGSALSLISPLGLGLKVEAFYTDAYWPVIVLFIEGLCLTALALFVGARRDVGAGVFAARAGKEHASRSLISPLGLAWRLSRLTCLIWAATFFILGMAYGAVVGELDTFVGGSDIIRQMLEGAGGGSRSYVESFVPMLSHIMSIIVAVPIISTVSRLRVEERRGRLEQIYARAVNRFSLYISFVGIAVMEAVVFNLLTAIGLYAGSMNTGLLTLGGLVRASAAYLPAILALAGASALLIGIAPKMLPLVWAWFAYSFLMMYFGRLMDLPDLLIKVSPFGNIPQMPIEPFRVLPIIVLSCLSLGMFIAGYMRYSQRDIY